MGAYKIKSLVKTLSNKWYSADGLQKEIDQMLNTINRQGGEYLDLSIVDTDSEYGDKNFILIYKVPQNHLQ